jgi:hypothetical protein
MMLLPDARNRQGLDFFARNPISRKGTGLWAPSVGPTYAGIIMEPLPRRNEENIRRATPSRRGFDDAVPATDTVRICGSYSRLGWE